MKKNCTAARLWALGCALALGLWCAPQTFAADDPDPAITLKTAYFDYADVNNLFTINMDVDEAIYVVVDCGFGPVEYELEPNTDGTWIPCTVDREGTVRMWTDKPEVINYFYCQGGHITEIDLSKLSGLQMLDLSNNDLRSIDLSHNADLRTLDLGSNVFDAEPLYIGSLPNLLMLEIESVGNISPDFTLSNFPELISFACFSAYGITHLDPSGCPKLRRLSADVTSLSSIDVSKNPDLQILNVSDTYITSIDVSKNEKLEQLYVGHHGSFAPGYKLDELDVTHNPLLKYLFAQNNNLKSVDLSKNPLLTDVSLQWNVLESFDCSANMSLTQVDISNNYLDFATLPLGRVFSLKYYYEQRPIPVEASYPVDGVLNLSHKVIREGTVTDMKLYGVSQKDLANPVLLSGNYYDYANGVIKFKKEYPDSVYASFSNADFPDCVLTTTKFMVKTAEQYGAPSQVIGFVPAADPDSDLSFGLGVSGASPESPRTVFIDFGDGKQVPVSVSSSNPDVPNIVGKRAGYGSVAVYVNDGDLVSALSIEDCPLYGISLEKAPSLRFLTLKGTDLSSIDLEWQRCLEVLTLSGNRFGNLDLTCDYLGYNKNVLHTVNVSDNKLETLLFQPGSNLKHLNVSDNSLEEITIDKAYNLISLDISHNEFSSISVENLDSLNTLNVAGNHLSFIDAPWQNTLRNLDCRENDFTFASLPYLPGELEGEFLYAPQNKIAVAHKGPGLNLSKVGLDVEGVPSVFVLHKEDGSIIKEGTDYEIKDGRVNFRDYSLGNVYCTVTNPAYPELTLSTTNILVAEPPTQVLGWMDVANNIASDNELFLSLAAANDGEALYINWDGEGKDFTEYLLKSTYTLFDVDAVPGRRVVLYGYDNTDFLTVFSLSGLALKKADFSNMSGVGTFDVSYSGCEDIVLPKSEKLRSLGLNGNGLSSIDPTGLENLTYLAADDNNLTTFDLTAYPKLQIVALRNNGMTDIKVDNPDIWFFGLAGNDFEEFNLDGLPGVETVDLSYCRLKKIDISGSKKLRELYIVANELDFQTLPIAPASVVMYYYTEQANVPAIINGLTVDLSSQASRNGVSTQFYWCVDEPYFDSETGELYAETLNPSTDYTINEGVTTFFADQANVCCLMMNELFPATFLLTDLMNLTANAVEEIVAKSALISVDGRTLSISAEEGTQYAVFTTDGKTISTGTIAEGSVQIELPAAGVYVVKAARSSMKIAVK